MPLKLTAILLFVSSLLALGTTKAFAQHQHDTDSCYHIELSLAHHYLELTYEMEMNEVDANSMLQGQISSVQLFTEFFRLVTLVQAKYPDHHLEVAFYDKAIQVANRQQNLSASAYLIQQKEKMLMAQYGADYLTKECHCGKCIRHED